jgi:3-oxoacyl-[acyl-carrier-protein] synthase II
MEVLCCLIAINNSKIAPTIHYVETDPECDLDYTVNKAREKNVDIALSNTFGLGGQNASLVISKYKR